MPMVRARPHGCDAGRPCARATGKADHGKATDYLIRFALYEIRIVSKYRVGIHVPFIANRMDGVGIHA
jgi:hypothetical protein